MERVRENYNSQVRSVKVKINQDKTLCIFACLLDFLKKRINISQKNDRYLCFFYVLPYYLKLLFILFHKCLKNKIVLIVFLGVWI